MIPQKPLAEAKSRLLAGRFSPVLAAAMLHDVVAASQDPAHTVWLLGGPALPSLGVGRLRDPGGGLSAAVSAAVADLSGPVAVVMADLPCLTSVDLRSALTIAEHVPLGVVADAAGTGTTLLTALSGAALRPSYGEGSFGRHRGLGAIDLLAAGPELPRLRRDVDTRADLEAAVLLGVGPATAAALDDLRLEVVHPDGP